MWTFVVDCGHRVGGRRESACGQWGSKTRCELVLCVRRVVLRVCLASTMRMESDARVDSFCVCRWLTQTCTLQTQHLRWWRTRTTQRRRMSTNTFLVSREQRRYPNGWPVLPVLSSLVNPILPLPHILPDNTAHVISRFLYWSHLAPLLLLLLPSRRSRTELKCPRSKRQRTTRGS